MTTLIQLTSPEGAALYVDPVPVNFVKAQGSQPGGSIIYFTNEHRLDAKEDLATVVSKLTS